MKNIGIDNKNNINNITNYNFQDKNKNDDLIDAIKKRIDNKQYKGIIGKGNYGNVYKIEYNNKIYAVKHLYGKKKIEDSQNEDINLSKLSELDNKHKEHIVEYYGSYPKDENNKYIIMEYAGNSNLKNFIEKYKKSHEYIKEKKIINIIKQICIGLRAIHNCGMIHRDLKPENIFIDEQNFNIKIGDFGTSKIAFDTNTNTGTPSYKAPEIISGEEYNNKVDMYSLGCIIYELFTLKEYYLNEEFNDIQEIDSVYDPKWQELIDKLLDTNPENRPNIEKVLFDYFGWKE